MQVAYVRTAAASENLPHRVEFERQFPTRFASPNRVGYSNPDISAIT